MPGTQPDAGINLDLSGACEQCHQDDDPSVTILHDWRGSMMSHAGRDPLYWATVAIAEQDFDGAGDLCIRCHTMGGWLGGQSTPTDGSALSDAEAAEGVGCEVCHKMTNPDDTEHVGEQNPPFIANDGGTPAEGYYGSAQLSMWSGNARLGPYSEDDAEAKHQELHSQFHRSVDFCGSCHDVSNPVVGDLAPNNGAQLPLDPGTFDGQLDMPTNPRNIEAKAAFNNPPYKYGVVERTYSEYKASTLSQTLVSDYGTLPVELQNGAIESAYLAAMGDGSNTSAPDYEDGAPRYFSCQTCHMQATRALGCGKNGVPLRNDQPMHDLTGGNYWIPEVMQYMDTAGTLLLGSGLSTTEISGMDAGVARAKANLENAASLSVTGNMLKVVNLTGHKLITGYPEGRRMWLNIVWKDATDATIREDGAYGPLQLDYDIDGNPGNDTVNTLLDLHDPNTRIYEVHGAITQEWAAKLIAVSASYGSIPVAYDRVSGTVTHTVASIAQQAPGTHHETFHFVLNNKVVKDTRIPPYGMDYDESLRRSILPVVPDNPGQYGNPGTGETYNYWDDFTLTPPPGAASAEIKLMYQPTSWEYIQFLDHANNGSVTFLANEGANMLDAWLNTGMAAPHVMETATWTPPDTDGDTVPDTDDNCPNDPNTDQANNDNDAEGDVCDDDDDNDGLSDVEEENFDGTPGYNQGTDTNPFSADTDGDGISDFDELNYDDDPAYDPAADTNPLSDNTDNDDYLDSVDPVPLNYNYEDGDIAPWGSPDSTVNAGDLLVCLQFVLGLKDPTNEDLAHADLYPVGAPDGEIGLSDFIQLQQLVFF
jgi:hypothetical protein